MKMSAFVLAAVCLACCLRTTPANEQEADAPSAATPGGITGVELRDLSWLAGDWDPVAPHEANVTVTRDAVGRYACKDAVKTWTFTVFEHDCVRFAEIRSGPSVVYARLSGHRQRVSFDLLPAMFPAAWKDPKILQALAIQADAVPEHQRRDALVHLAHQIDTVGTFMHQDITWFRPGVLDRRNE